jgi:hypothetical protein
MSKVIDTISNYYSGIHRFITYGSGSNIVTLSDLTNATAIDVLYLASSNVGIGTTNPLQPLHVQGQSYFTNSVGIGTTNPLKSLHIQGNTYASSSIGIGTTNPLQPLHIQGNTYASSSIGIGTANPLQPLHIQGNTYASSSIGIGTANPLQPLHILGNTTLTGTYPQLYINGDGITGGILKFNVQNIGPPATTYSSGGARIVLYDSANGSTNYGHCIGIEAGNNWYCTSALGNGHKFYGGNTHLVSIDGNGSLWLASSPKIYGGPSTSYNSIEFISDGSTSLYFGPNTTSRQYRFALQNDRNIVLYDGATGIWATATQTSDSNVKDNIIPTQQNTTEIIKKLNVVDFTWKEDSVLNDGGKIHTGFIAQEVEQMIPDAVYTPSNDGNKMLHKDVLIPYLTKALQDALIRIDNLEKIVANLTQ